MEIGYSSAESAEMFLGWEKLSKNERYLGLFQGVNEQFDYNPIFRAACIQASKWVLEKRVPDTENISLSTLESATRYLLAEIPLFLDSAGIFGADSSVFCYHQCISFLETLFNNGFPISVGPTQGFVVLEAALKNESSGVNKEMEPGYPNEL